MDRLGLAGLCDQRYCNPPFDGAALTYARRYALFTLVGIAGEDDLDAPDLLPTTAPETKTDGPAGNKKDRLNGGQGQSIQKGSGGHRIKASSTPLRPKLDAETSTAVREQLITELGAISSADEAATWAHRVMGTKRHSKQQLLRIMMLSQRSSASSCCG